MIDSEPFGVIGSGSPSERDDQGGEVLVSRPSRQPGYRAAGRLLTLVVIPGYLLMVITGLLLSRLAWSLTFTWIQSALILWIVGAVTLVASLAFLQKQIALFAPNRATSAPYQRASRMGRLLGGASGFIIIVILYLMVAKPTW
jgi:uncharacterized membrane protein